jgi:hypothetical protein
MKRLSNHVDVPQDGPVLRGGRHLRLKIKLASVPLMMRCLTRGNDLDLGLILHAPFGLMTT